MFRKNRKTLLALSFIIIISIILTSCKEEVKIEKPDQLRKLQEGDLVATIDTSKGDITLRLLEDVAPRAVESFVGLAEEGYYNGLHFHRLIPNFMIQGGDPTGTGTGGESYWGEPFEDEFDDKTKHYMGAVSMANSGPNTNGSQFFIVQPQEVDEELLTELKKIAKESGDDLSKEIYYSYKEFGGTPWLDFKHTVFGQVVNGMDVVNELISVETDEEGYPIDKDEVKINKIEIYNYKPEEKRRIRFSLS